MTDTAPVLNTELLEAAADWAIEHEKSDWQDREEADWPNIITWDQTYYRRVDPECGTTMCLAGIACTIAGGVWLTVSSVLEYLQFEPGDEHSTVYYDEIRVTWAHVRAKRILGLTNSEAEYLFDGDYAGAEALRKRVKRVSNGELR